MVSVLTKDSSILIIVLKVCESRNCIFNMMSVIAICVVANNASERARRLAKEDKSFFFDKIICGYLNTILLSSVRNRCAYI